MKDYFFEDLSTPFSLAKQVKIEDEIIYLEQQLQIRKDILKVAEIRTESATYWDDATPQERANFGKSEDEIKNGDNAKSKSVIDFGGVSNLSFAELPTFWRSAWLAGTAEYFFKLKKTHETEQEEQA